ncbi:MAG: sugar phosphate isomerase/epimerase [Planctomycetia bacterium]|nr:sugar phosphate isomerase/epimerase [Planctomycetia bacterium]
MPDLTRRSFLTSLGAAAGGWPARILFADDRARAKALPLGFSLYGMKSVPVAEALAACAKIGYDAIELVANADWPTEPKNLTAGDRRELAGQIKDLGLALCALMENLHEPADDATHAANLDRLKAAAELGHALSPQLPPVIETVLGGKPAEWDQIKDRLAERLQRWAETAAAAQTVIAVKPHVSNALQNPERALWLMRQVDSRWIRLAFDYSHFWLQGLPLAETVAALMPHTSFIHVKDARGTAEKFEFLLAGEGQIDYAAYLRQVATAGYRGPVVAEVSAQISTRAGYDPLAAARTVYEKLAPAMREAGVRR